MSAVPANRSIMVSANSAWAFTNYRLGLLKALQKDGFSLIAAVPDDGRASKLRSCGVDVRHLPIDAHGKSPLTDLRLVYRYFRLLRELRPAVFLGFTIKPNIYGALAASLTGTPVVNNVTGLGFAFTRAGPLRATVKTMYRMAFRSSYHVFFQNPESRDLFLSEGLVRGDQAGLLPGSGIDLDRFRPEQCQRVKDADFTFLLPARMLWQKGIREYCEAACRVRGTFPDVRFQLAGSIESERNSDAIPRQKIEQWQREGIEYLGETDDIRPLIAQADCVVLASCYAEGVPRALIEAAAMGKPIITTDTAGCRLVIDVGKTGFLCAPGSVDALAAAMLNMISCTPQERSIMGAQARAKAERDFDERFVIEAYLNVIRAILPRCEVRSDGAVRHPFTIHQQRAHDD